ncbi:Hypothetical protein KLENKIAIHU_784, partial [Klenkia terrae]|jgi:hypothetical protein
VDLSRRLAEAAVRRTCVLVVEVPGWAATRYAAELAIRRRGWRLASSPADADVLLTCGTPGPRLAEAVGLLWEQVPGPRARATVTARSAVDAAMEQAAAALLDTGHQRADAAQRSPDPAMGTRAEHDEDDEDSGGSENQHADEEHASDGSDGDMNDSDMNDGGGDMDMDMEPGGIPLAGGAQDRDGLEMDVLHVPLGPVLPHWPAGLLLHCTLSGDVVTEARPEVLGAAVDAVPDPPMPGASAVDRLDRAARLLYLAGWEARATDALRLRDDLLAGNDDASVAAGVDRLVARIRRSWVLRWSLRGTGPISSGTCEELGLDDRATGDVHDRLVICLTEARSALEGDRLPAPVSPEILAELLPGLEIGAVRLLVASLDLDTGAHLSTGTAAR